jgi:soluble lytic murein transglycosylase-like protein
VPSFLSSPIVFRLKPEATEAVGVASGFSRKIGAWLMAGAVLLLCPAAAQAQIYAWRDASGHLVLSDTPKDPSAKSYAISAAPTAAFRTTRPLNKRAALYHTLIEEHAALNLVSADLVRALIQAESAFNPRALSPKGAMGLMQLMPATAAEHGVRDPFDPVENIRAGVKYLKSLLDAYDGRVELALAAYNAGPGAVKKYGGKVPPYRETQNYVSRIQGTTAANGTMPPSTRVYRVVEIVDGREIVRYTGTPRSGSERLGSAERR